MHGPVFCDFLKAHMHGFPVFTCIPLAPAHHLIIITSCMSCALPTCHPYLHWHPALPLHLKRQGHVRPNALCLGPMQW